MKKKFNMVTGCGGQTFNNEDTLSKGSKNRPMVKILVYRDCEPSMVFTFFKKVLKKNR